MWFEPIFFQVLWQFLAKNAASPSFTRASRKSRGLVFALRPAQGEIRSSYFQYTPPVRIWQVDNCLVPRCGSALGHQFIFIFG